MATLFPGDPINAGTPQIVSGVGGTGTSGGALGAEQAYEAAFGGVKNTAAAPQTGGFRTIVWDAVKLDGTDFGGGPNTTVIDLNKTVGIPLNRFQTQGVFFEEVYAVSGDGFTDVNPNVTGLFPAFSPKNVFAMFNENTIDFDFIVPSAAGSAPALGASRGFGAIFLNNEVANASSIELFHGAESLGKFFVPVGTQGQPEFLGVLFNNPIVTHVTLTLGTDTLFDFNGRTFSSSSTNNPPSHNLVATDDFVYPEPVSSVDAVPIQPGPVGTLNATPKADATVGTAFTGVVATFSDDAHNANASEFTATINWGDGDTTNGLVQSDGKGGFSVTGTNTFTTARVVPISVHIADFEGAADLDVANVIQVTPANTQISLTVSPIPGTAGQPATLTASVSTTAGTPVGEGFVIFEDGNVPIAAEPVNSAGMATFSSSSIALGSHSFTANFLGTNNFNSILSAAKPWNVIATVTSQFKIALGAVTKSGKNFVETVTLTNNGSTLIGPLALVLDNLKSGTKLLNASGKTTKVPPLGSPFIFVNLGSSHQIASGQQVSVQLSFSAKSASGVGFTPRLLVGVSIP
jgi:hypothetical protein